MMLTVESLKNPVRKSGYDHVQQHPQETRKKRYRAISNGATGPGRGMGWGGPFRATAEEAAQDYCEWFNAGGTRNHPSANKLNYPGHATRRSTAKDPEEEAALGVLRDVRAQRKGRQGYVYLIAVKGDPLAVKIGYSVNPEARVGELQTGNPRELYLLAKMPGTLADEKAIHTKFKHKNLIGEWFKGHLEVINEFNGFFVARRTA